MNDISTAVDAARDAAHRALTDDEHAYGVMLEAQTFLAREEFRRATGERIAQLMVERLPADAYIRHLDALLAAVRDLAHARVGRTEPAMLRVMAAWDVIEDAAVAAIVDREMKR